MYKLCIVQVIYSYKVTHLTLKEFYFARVVVFVCFGHVYNSSLIYCQISHKNVLQNHSHTGRGHLNVEG